MRVRSLDSLRGVAALVVVLHHCLLVFPSRSPNPAFDLRPTPWSWLDQTPLRITTVGHSAVLVFFALSGFVLTLALSGRPQSYLQFALKRLARIWPPLAFAVLVSASLYLVVRPHPLPLSAWFANASWRDPPSLRLVFEHLILSDRQRWQGLDNVIWSLSPEVRMSLVFPLIVILVRRAAWATALGAVAISAVAAWLAPRHAAGWAFDPLTTLQYTYLFALGAVLATHRERIARAVTRLPAAARAALWGVALVLVTYPSDAALGLVTGSAAILLVTLCFADAGVDRLLVAPAPEWLGRVSYSLYLIHLPILLTLVHGLSGRLPLPAILALTLAASLVAAELMHRAVELPSIHLGRWLAARTAPRRRAPLLA